MIKIVNKNEIITKYINGVSIRSISKELHINRKKISKILKENNIEIRKQEQTSRIYNCNENYFEVIDDEFKAYWLGFIYADGFIESKRKHGSQKFGITISKVDENHLYKLSNCLNSNYEIKTYIGSGYNENGKFSKLLITSQKLVNDLKDKGVVENKTNIITFPYFLNKDLIRHFIRGYFDGDGSIYVETKNNAYSISFTGTYEILEGMNFYFNKNNKISKYKNKNAYELHYGGNLQVKKILDIIYINSNIYLDRKYDKYKELIKYIER